MDNKNLILTFDYELFGDGSGDVFAHIIGPTNQILSLCEKYGIKTTIFFEVLEYIKLKEEWASGNTMGYTENPVKAIEKQIKEAANDGHDIQLHIHPHWYNAVYKNGKWELDFSNWRLGSFQGSSGYGVKDLLIECKTELENIIIPVKKDYQCIALRAGGYNIMPSEKVYKAMKEIGLKIDSSVFPGGYEKTQLSMFDYTGVSRELDFWWGDEKDISLPSKDKTEVLELPVFALPVTRLRKHLNWTKLKSFLFRKDSSAISTLSQEKFNNKNIKDIVAYSLQKEVFTWDVCMFSKALHGKFFNDIESRLLNKRKSFVLIGHPKSLTNQKLFDSFLKMAKSRKQNYSFKTLSEKYAEIVG